MDKKVLSERVVDAGSQGHGALDLAGRFDPSTRQWSSQTDYSKFKLPKNWKEKLKNSKIKYFKADVSVPEE